MEFIPTSQPACDSNSDSTNGVALGAGLSMCLKTISFDASGNTSI